MKSKKQTWNKNILKNLGLNQRYFKNWRTKLKEEEKSDKSKKKKSSSELKRFWKLKN
jgi:hypothetical protein